MKKIYFLFVVLIGLQAVQASNGKYRLTLRDNPATSIVIGWDQTSGNDPVVHYGTTDFGTNFNNYPSTKTPDRVVSHKGMNNNFARLTGLTPNTAYYFVIRDSDGTSQRFWFKTAPSDNSRLSFIAGGDSRNNRSPRQNANRLVAKLKPHAVLFGGDMTSSDSSSQWRQWMGDWQLTIASDGRMFPIVATRGNHEDSNNSIYRLFDVPSSNVYYAITFGQNLVRTYTLNTEISISGSQTTWLQNDLTANPNTVWKMAQYHKPMRPHVSSKREGNDQYNNWAQLFYDNNVKLVIECDAHTVKTTWPVRPSTGSGSDEGFVRDDANGTVYAGEGCWGAPLRSNNDEKSWTRNSARFNQFKWIFVDANKIETRTIKVDNASQVGSVSNDNVFAIPANLDIWNPSNGSVVTINAPVTIPDTEAPAAPTNLVSSNVTENTVSLSWNASTDNVAVSEYDVYQGNAKIASTTTTTYNVSGLSSSTSYAFRIKAKDAAGNVSEFSATENVTTSAPDTQAPSAPANLTSSNVTAASVSLSWNASTDNVAVLEYDVYQDNTKIASTATTTYNVIGLSSNTSYAFKIKAKDAAGNVSGFSAAETITTLDASTIPQTLGITTVGDRNATHATRRAMSYTMPENGILQSIAIHVVGGTGDMQLGVYADDNGAPGNRLGKTPVTTVRSTTGWQTISLESPVTANNGDTVWLSWIFSNNPGVAYVTGSPGRYQANGTSWSAGGDNTPSTYGSGAQSDFRYSVYANYLKNQSTITYTLTTNTVGQGTVSGAGTYNENSSVTVTANPASGWEFDGWSGALSGTTNPDTVIMNTNKTLTATFKEITTGGTTEIIGITTIGDRDATHAARRAMSYTMPENGTLQSITIHVAGGTGDMQLGVYEDNNGVPGNRLGKTAVTAVQSTRGWQTVSLESPVSVSNGDTIWLSWIFSNNPGVAYATGSPGRYQADGTSWSVGGDNTPSTYGSGAQSDFRYSIYATYLKSQSSKTSLNQIESFSIYPNPFTNTINISGAALGSIKDYSVVIRDLSGKVIHTEKVSSKSKNENISISPEVHNPGIYLLSIRNENGKIIKTKRLINK